MFSSRLLVAVLFPLATALTVASTKTGILSNHSLLLFGFEEKFKNLSTRLQDLQAIIA